MIDGYLVPVSESRRGKSVPDQITKVAVELNEVREAYSKYEMMKVFGKSTEELERQKRAVAVETGDVMVACSTLMHMLRYQLSDVLRDVYCKNASRGYYGEREK